MDTVKIISAEEETLTQYFKRLWEYRNLILIFARRDLKIKYAQTYLGVFWVLLQPIPSVIIFTFFFGRLIHVDTGILPYPVFALLGMIGWNYFTNLSNGIGGSLAESQNILQKIYFPKLVLPLAKMVTGMVDFTISFLAIVVCMLLFRVFPSYTIIFFPLFVFINILAGFAVGIWISALSFKFRDIHHIAPFVIGFSIWLTPVFYPTTILPQSLHYIMYFNPMALVIAGYRFSLGGDAPPDPHLLFSILPILFVFVAGLLYFRKIEDKIAEFV